MKYTKRRLGMTPPPMTRCGARALPCFVRATSGEDGPSLVRDGVLAHRRQLGLHPWVSTVHWPAASRGRCSHSHTALYFSLVIIRTKCTGRAQMTLTSTPRCCPDRAMGHGCASNLGWRGQRGLVGGAAGQRQWLCSRGAGGGGAREGVG
jgi:hypothetical protein